MSFPEQLLLDEELDFVIITNFYYKSMSIAYYPEKEIVF